ncbi:NUDIX hydrolase [Corallincola holothuriorum]|uniref:Phosphatase NudJ n=1 Tax=Corallincola holothuriorum TaxID=2282215 RepID=A0A368NSH3_9GAMM|nr:NUDIX hydrolase [Corallincola holothuriorum]RCU52419.1 NUDIX hydrolase [Corallincola holothuriorum]
MYKPEVTLACVIEYDGKFLLVEEQKQGQMLLNNPAGHLEPGESLIQGAQREILEETGLDISPQGLVGVYLAPTAEAGRSYLRFCFYYKYDSLPPASKPLDPEISCTHWMTKAELVAASSRHRSGLVLKGIEDYLSGQRAPLTQLHYCPDQQIDRSS